MVHPSNRLRTTIAPTMGNRQNKINFLDCLGRYKALLLILVRKSLVAWELLSIHRGMPNMVNRSLELPTDLEVLLLHAQIMM